MAAALAVVAPAATFNSSAINNPFRVVDVLLVALAVVEPFAVQVLVAPVRLA